ncbi:MAG: YdeI/OmpD-associated family protein [Chitinophagales bacterium]
MLQFSTTILQFGAQGEKTGWTYILIPAVIAQKINPGIKKSFRVKGKLDDYSFQGIALLPMGEGDFIMALKAEIRKKIKKGKGAKLNVQLELDRKPLKISGELLECLQDEPKALDFFLSLAKSHQGYFSKWIESAKTEATRAKRIAIAVSALARKFGFSEMVRAENQKNHELRS